MTNNMIIFWASVELMNEGKLKGTGREVIVQNPMGIPVKIEEPEAIHTFAAWKQLGYSVKKGQHAIAAITIWKGAEKPLKDENGKDLDEKELKMFRKVAHFFTFDQVEKTEAKPA